MTVPDLTVFQREASGSLWPAHCRGGKLPCWPLSPPADPKVPSRKTPAPSAFFAQTSERHAQLTAPSDGCSAPAPAPLTADPARPPPLRPLSLSVFCQDLTMQCWPVFSQPAATAPRTPRHSSARPALPQLPLGLHRCWGRGSAPEDPTRPGTESGPKGRPADQSWTGRAMSGLQRSGMREAGAGPWGPGLNASHLSRGGRLTAWTRAARGGV